jgi:alginate O-acetyltransferase complex protein AlgI
MSLTSLIQDYLFSPLSKLVIIHVPRRWQIYGIALAYVLSMILVAMWHGTTLGFLIFGILQGAVLFGIQIRRERARIAAKAKGARATPKAPNPLGVWTGRVATYAFVSITMIWWHSSVAAAIVTYRALLGWR